MKRRALLPVAVLLAGCTAVRYESPEFAQRTRGHQTIAVLPFEMVYVGKMPKGLTPEQIAEIEEAESLAFQLELYNRLLNQSSVHRKRPITVQIQPVEATNRMLQQHDIDIRRSWDMAAEDLANLLGVDAVIRTSVQKARYLSELVSYGIDVGIHVLHEATAGEAVPWVPPGLTKTYDIWADCELVSRDEGDLLWKVAVQRSTDWHRPANEVIAGITGKLAKKFPYRA